MDKKLTKEDILRIYAQKREAFEKAIENRKRDLDEKMRALTLKIEKEGSSSVLMTELEKLENSIKTDTIIRFNKGELEKLENWKNEQLKLV